MWEHEEKQEDIDSLQAEIISRNHIINALREQLTENQTGFLEKISSMVELRENFEQQQRFNEETKNELVRKNNELKSHRQYLEKKDNELYNLQTELDIRTKDLQIKQQEIADLTKQVQGMFSKLKATTSTNEPIIRMLNTQLGEKDNLLDILKVDQLINQDEKKSLAGDIDHITKNGQDHIDQLNEDIKWNEKLQICNEIEKCLDHTADDHFKTKKLKDEETK
jgi:chromosome segregation ATPase